MELQRTKEVGRSNLLKEYRAIQKILAELSMIGRFGNRSYPEVAWFCSECDQVFRFKHRADGCCAKFKESESQ